MESIEGFLALPCVDVYRRLEGFLALSCMDVDRYRPAHAYSARLGSRAWRQYSLSGCENPVLWVRPPASRSRVVRPLRDRYRYRSSAVGTAPYRLVGPSVSPITTPLESTRGPDSSCGRAPPKEGSRKRSAALAKDLPGTAHSQSTHSQGTGWRRPRRPRKRRSPGRPFVGRASRARAGVASRRCARSRRPLPRDGGPSQVDAC